MKDLLFKSEKGPLLVSHANAIVQRLQAEGFIAYFAGGCVRDALRGAYVKDIDIATSATPDEIANLFPSQSVGVGKSFGVMLVIIDGFSYDVATFRTDGGYQDGRHPTSITFDSAEHDALRRDFTINALFYDPIAQHLIDYVGGEADLAKGILRTVGNPLQRFKEDRLRMLRAIRFATVCNWDIQDETWQAICQEASAISCVSMERIHTEFIRTLCEAQKPSTAMRLLEKSGLLKVFFPEIVRLKGCKQDPIWHPEGDVWQHTMRMLDFMPLPRDPLLVWSVLLHDIGKPETLQVLKKPDGSPWFRTPGHAEAGAHLAESILMRFKSSRATIDAVSVAVKHHMHFIEFPKMRTSTKCRFLGRPTIAMELELHRLDCLSSHANLNIYNLVKQSIESYANRPILPQPFLTGKRLIAMGYPSGKQLGNRIKDYYTRQLEGATEDELLRLALLHAPGGPKSSPKKIVFVYGPGKPFNLRDVWETLCKRPSWQVTLVIEQGVTWDEPYSPDKTILRQVADCAGNVTPIDLTVYDVICECKE
jgi:poly(A) polymerase